MIIRRGTQMLRIKEATVHRGRERDKQTCRQAGRQTNREKERETEKQGD